MTRFPRTKIDDTGVFQTEVASIKTKSESAHRVARAVMREEGKALLVVDANSARALDTGRKLMAAGDFDVLVFAESPEEAKKMLLEKTIEAVAIEDSIAVDCIESFGDIAKDKLLIIDATHYENGKNGEHGDT